MRRILVLAILTASAHGLLEGIVMHQPGPRTHVAFWAYHTLALALYAGIATLAMAVAVRRPRPVAVLGALVLMWEASEACYGVSRSGALPMYEHVVIADLAGWYVTGWALAALHAARVAIGAALVWMGRRNRCR